MFNKNWIYLQFYNDICGLLRKNALKLTSHIKTSELSDILLQGGVEFSRNTQKWQR